MSADKPKPPSPAMPPALKPTRLPGRLQAFAIRRVKADAEEAAVEVSRFSTRPMAIEEAETLDAAPDEVIQVVEWDRVVWTRGAK